MLEVTTGYTDDGLVYLHMEGQQDEHGRPIRTIVTMEPDMAENVAKRMLAAAKSAWENNKRPLIVGQPQTIDKDKIDG
jgi:hypothetical protein